MYQISRCLEDLVRLFQAEHTDFGDLTTRAKAITLAKFLRAHNLTGIEEGKEYHSLEHNFLGIALYEDNHNSLPLISVVIYCHIAQSLGLDAHPCGFPLHVHAIVRSPKGSDLDGKELSDSSLREPMYVDPFRSTEETPVKDLRSQLDFLGALPQSHPTFLRESPTSEIVLRSARNILHSLRQDAMASFARMEADNAKYAALWALTLVGAPENTELEPFPITVQHRQNLPYLIEHFATHFPSDYSLIEQYILPLFEYLPEYTQLCMMVHAMRAGDDVPKQIRRRTAETKHVKYKVGQVFRHRRYEYRAVITGWDPKCDASEQWQRQMDVRGLAAGANQSFYHAL